MDSLEMVLDGNRRFYRGQLLALLEQLTAAGILGCSGGVEEPLLELLSVLNLLNIFSVLPDTGGLPYSEPDYLLRP